MILGEHESDGQGMQVGGQISPLASTLPGVTNSIVGPESTCTLADLACCAKTSLFSFIFSPPRMAGNQKLC